MVRSAAAISRWCRRRRCAQEAPVSDVKADYELVQKIGSKRAWEVFLGTHPTGFYADLARAQIEKSKASRSQPPATCRNLSMAALPQPPSTPAATRRRRKRSSGTR